MKKEMSIIKQRLMDFFFVYYDNEMQRLVKKNPELCLGIIRDDITGLHKYERVKIYADALRDALDYNRLALEINSKAIQRPVDASKSNTGR